MELYAFFFWIVAGLTCGSAIAVVVTQNIVRSAAWLLFTLAGTSVLYFLLGADFVAGTQLIVYVGGVLVLVVFGVMLTAQGPFVTMKASAAEWAVSVIAGLLFLALLIGTIRGQAWATPEKLQAGDPATSGNSVTLGQAMLGIKEATPKGNMSGMPAEIRDPDSSQKMAVRPLERSRMGYLLPFEIVSIHLLVVLIGAAYLARAKRRRGEPS